MDDCGDSDGPASPGAAPHRLAVGDIHPNALQSLADGGADGLDSPSSPDAAGAGVSTVAAGPSAFAEDDDDSDSDDDSGIVALNEGSVVRRRHVTVAADDLPGVPAGVPHAVDVIGDAKAAQPQPVRRRPRGERRISLPAEFASRDTSSFTVMHAVPPNPWPISGAEGWWFDARPLMSIGVFADPAAHPEDLASPLSREEMLQRNRLSANRGSQLAVEVAKGAKGNSYTIYRRDIPTKALADVEPLPPTVAPFPAATAVGGSGALRRIRPSAFEGLKVVALTAARIDDEAFKQLPMGARPLMIPTTRASTNGGSIGTVRRLPPAATQHQQKPRAQPTHADLRTPTKQSTAAVVAAAKSLVGPPSIVLGKTVAPKRPVLGGHAVTSPPRPFQATKIAAVPGPPVSTSAAVPAPPVPNPANYRPPPPRASDPPAAPERRPPPPPPASTQGSSKTAARSTQPPAYHEAMPNVKPKQQHGAKDLPVVKSRGRPPPPLTKMPLPAAAAAALPVGISRAVAPPVSTHKSSAVAAASVPPPPVGTRANKAAVPPPPVPNPANPDPTRGV